MKFKQVFLVINFSIVGIYIVAKQLQQNDAKLMIDVLRTENWRQKAANQSFVARH